MVQRYAYRTKCDNYKTLVIINLTRNLIPYATIFRDWMLQVKTCLDQVLLTNDYTMLGYLIKTVYHHKEFTGVYGTNIFVEKYKSVTVFYGDYF